MSKLLNVSSSPHVRCGVSTKNLMYDVAIAMLPATIWGVMQFGIYSLIVVVATVLSCVLSEYLFETLMHKPVTISDGSALVTGMILGLNMPPAIPLWMPILGGVFAIIVVKQLYGGLGQNWMNPALAARCFMLISFAQAMTKFTDPVTDAVASATPLAAIKAGDTYDLAAMFIGKIPGTIGEVSVIALLIGAAYLLVKKVITIRIPAAYILSFAVFAFIFGQHNINYVLAEVCGGGLIFGACRRTSPRSAFHGYRLCNKPDHCKRTDRIRYLPWYFNRTVPYLRKRCRGRFLRNYLLQHACSVD